MNDKNMQWILVGLVVLVLASLFFVMGRQQIVVSSDQTARISVTGNAETEVMPDKAQISLTVLTEGKDAQKVQEENAVKMNTVVDALKQNGVDEKDIETSNYNLYPWDEWDPITQKMISKGYRLQQTITVSTTDVKNVGKLLDIAVANGINNVNNVAFMLSDTQEAAVKAELLAEASAKAKEKAKTLADNLGVSLGGVLTVSESGYYPPMYYSSYMAKGGVAEAAVDTSISPQNVKVSLQVNVDYRIK